MGDETVLVRILDGEEDPKDLPLALLQSITNDFSEDRKIGQGGFGAVYKGVLRNGIIVAVKRIEVNPFTIDDESFRREFNSLMNINHRNVVRFLGFCSNTHHTSIKEAGELNLVNIRERLLCFEYIGNGSLDRHITDELRGLEWETRYEIITGICKGLRYLHEEKNIVHMDIKPANILLDGTSMVPKITDFGLSRSNKNSHTVGLRFGTQGYVAPEYNKDGKTSFKCDIYSLGVIIIELVTGCKGIPHKNNVLRRWRHRWNKPPTLIQYQQLTRCIDIAIRCREQKPEARPSILEIVSFLNKSESMDVHTGQASPCFDEDDMLGIKPLELRIPSELKKGISCSIELTNDTHNCIAFNIQLPSGQQYIAQPYKGIVQPESKYPMKITVQPRDVHEHHHADKFIVQSMKVSDSHRDENIIERMFKEASEVVDEVNFMVVYEPMKPQENCKSREDTNMLAKEFPEVIKARHQLLDQDNIGAQYQIHEVREQLRQLDNDLSKLRTTMAPKMLDLINRVEWQSHKKPAADLLPDIKDAVYDAEDLLDEFNYYAMKLGVEQSKNSRQDHMEGAFLRFYNSIKDSGHFSKVKEIQDKLDHIYEQSKDLGLHQAPQKFDRSIRPETCSFSDEPQIFGRKKELEQLVQKLGVRARNRGRTDGEERMTELPVLPIVGMGGVGKTTMAQQICNDAKVNTHFDCIVWTCVSDDFDIKRLTREILQHFGKQTQADANLDFLMKELAHCVRSTKFLLVLDDMWDDILKERWAEWKKFCKPLKSGLQGSMILVTTRSSEVSSQVGTMNYYELAGLPDDVFWMFFKLQAFGSKSPSNYPELVRIGKAILPKLKGSPLAAKTLGRLLSRDLNTTHWKHILESELWQLEQNATDILPALRLSYMYLPLHLKRCFSICALYPKDHIFEKDVLVNIWIAHGYVQPQDASFCFDDLANRSFFQRKSQKSDKFVIHDLIHDTAQLVSKDECFIIRHASDIHKIPSNVRHLSIFTGNIDYSELKSICNKKKLRSLVGICSSPTKFAAVIDSWFRELLKIRVLSFEFFGVTQLPESIGNSKHLRYLCLSGVSEASSSNSVAAFSSLAGLTIIECRGLLSLGEFSYLPALKKIRIESCPELTSLPFDKLHGFSCLVEMTIRYCPKLNRPRVMILPSSLKKLKLYACGGIETIDFHQLGSSPGLELLYLLNCPDLRCIGVSINVARTEHVAISGCPRLTEIEQPFRHGDSWRIW